MQTTVANIRTHTKTGNEVYIGRGSKWGNPFVINTHGTRKQVIDKYREWLWKQDSLINSLPELRGKTLLCYCKPQDCHGDVLAAICNQMEV